MSITMSRPSTKAAAQRRRLRLWLPLLLAGALVSATAGPMITGFNSLDGLGLAGIVGGLLGFAWDAEQ